MSVGLLGTTIGSILIASWFATALSGIVLFQAYRYFRGRPAHDHVVYRGLIIFLCAVDVGHVWCITDTIYNFLIPNFGNNAAVTILPAPLGLTVGLTASITFVVHSFFAWRVWKISRGHKVIPLILAPLLLARLACGWTTSVKAIQVGTFDGFVLHVRWIFMAGLIIQVVADILITSSLCYWLNESRSGMIHMDAILDKIILYSIETGALTSMVSIVSLICVSTMPRNLIFIAVHFVISKLYINMFLASLNTRSALRSHNENRHMSKSGNSFNFSNRQFGVDRVLENSFALQSPGGRRYPPNFDIMTSTVTEVHRDGNNPDYDAESTNLSEDMTDSNMSIKIAPGF